MSDRCLYDISRFSGRRGFKNGHGWAGVARHDNRGGFLQDNQREKCWVERDPNVGWFTLSPWIGGAWTGRETRLRGTRSRPVLWSTFDDFRARRELARYAEPKGPVFK